MTDPGLPDLLETLSDLGSLLGQRHEETRRLLIDSVERVNMKLNEIDRLLLAAARIMQQIDTAMRARPQALPSYRDRETPDA